MAGEGPNLLGCSGVQHAGERVGQQGTDPAVVQAAPVVLQAQRDGEETAQGGPVEGHPHGQVDVCNLRGQCRHDHRGEVCRGQDDADAVRVRCGHPF